MKREIKFNAWDGKKMLKNVGTHPHMIKSLVKIPNCTNQDSDCEYKKDSEGSIIVCQKFTAYTLLQFTGLLDKNGKEIYEGDIVQNNRIERAPVIFENGCFGLDITRRNGDHWFMVFSPGGLKNKEIIGNIYENPNLL